MRLYEYAESSLGLFVIFVGFAVHTLIYSWDVRPDKRRLGTQNLPVGDWFGRWRLVASSAGASYYFNIG